MKQCIRSIFLFLAICLPMQSMHATMSLKHAAATLAGCVLPAACAHLLLNRYVFDESTFGFYSKVALSAIAGITGLYLTFGQTPNGKLYWAESGIDACKSSTIIAEIRQCTTAEDFLLFVNEQNNQDYTNPAIIHWKLHKQQQRIDAAQQTITAIKVHHANNAEFLNRCNKLEAKIKNLKPVVDQALEWIQKYHSLKASEQLYARDTKAKIDHSITDIFIFVLLCNIMCAHLNQQEILTQLHTRTIFTTISH